jgi:hypothetical protein
MIKSEKLNVYTIEQTKVALSNFDDKRYILDDGYTTLAHGHYRIRGDIRLDPSYTMVKRLEKFQVAKYQVDGNWIECAFDLNIISLREVGQGAEPI